MQEKENLQETCPQVDCTNDAIDQIDRLLVTLLDAYTANSEDRLVLAVAVLSWLFTNIVHSRTTNYTANPAQAQVLENLCNILKKEAITNLLDASRH